jgi:hypothetical protein
MPGGTRAQLGNELFGQIIYLPAVTYPTLGANATADNTVTIPGVLPGDMISWNIQAPPAHLIIDNTYISAANVMTIRWSTDSTGISTGSVAVLFEILRPENQSQGIATLPASLS